MPERFVRDPAVLWRNTLDGVVILGGDAVDPILLGATGPLLWELLSGPTSVDEMVDAFTGVFDVPASNIRDDIRSVLEQLIDIGAVRRADLV